MDWKFPYVSKRMPLLAGNCVATTQPLAAQAGLSMLVQVGVRMFALGQNPQAAINAPRWRVEGEKLMIETAWGEDFRRGLAARGHVLEESPPMQFGASQVVWRLPAGGYVAASENRRDGQAVGF